MMDRIKSINFPAFIFYKLIHRLDSFMWVIFQRGKMRPSGDTVWAMWDNRCWWNFMVLSRSPYNMIYAEWLLSFLGVSVRIAKDYLFFLSLIGNFSGAVVMDFW